MKTIRSLGKYFMTAVMLILLPMSANATAVFDAEVMDRNDGAVLNWKYQVSSGNPGNPDSCNSNGSDVPWEWNGDLKSPSGFRVVSLGPPFSGGRSATRYLTACHGDNYAIVRMSINMSGCAIWVCNTSWDFQVLEQTGIAEVWKPYAWKNFLGIRAKSLTTN